MLATVFDEVLYRFLVLAVDRTADMCYLLSLKICGVVLGCVR